MGLKQDVLNEIEKKQLLWFGHVQRMQSNRLPKNFWIGNRKKEGKEASRDLVGKTT